MWSLLELCQNTCVCHYKSSVEIFDVAINQSIVEIFAVVIIKALLKFLMWSFLEL